MLKYTFSDINNAINPFVLNCLCSKNQQNQQKIVIYYYKSANFPAAIVIMSYIIFECLCACYALQSVINLTDPVGKIADL